MSKPNSRFTWSPVKEYYCLETRSITNRFFMDHKLGGHSTWSWRDVQGGACSPNIPYPNQGSRREGSSYYSFCDPCPANFLQSVYNKYKLCLTTGRPLRSGKVSLRRLLTSFNDHIQIDFVFLREHTKMPTVHIVDSKYVLPVAKVVTSRELDEAVRVVETEWFNVYGPPLTASTDPEFAKDPFLPFLKHYEVKFEPRPARRHNKIGIVESKNNILTRRLVKDADYFKTTRGTSATTSEILSRAVFLADIPYGDKRLSSLEMVRGYTPSFVGLPKTQVYPSKFTHRHAKIPLLCRCKPMF